MSSLEHLIRFESAHSGLLFRKTLYASGEDAEVLIDSLALANADHGGRTRYLLLGVDDSAEDSSRLSGIESRDLRTFGSRLDRLIAECIEPRLKASVRGVEIDGKLIGVVRFKDCSARPYLAKTAMGAKLPAGVGYIRRGARNLSLKRADLQRMFGAGAGHASAVRVGFYGGEPVERLVLPALPAKRLPSQVAADALESLLAAKAESRNSFGRTETRLSRLVHARFYGMDAPFKKQSDESLLQALDNVEADYRLADEHYLYEVRAHQLNLLVVNDGEANLHEARIRVSLPRLKRAGVAERIHSENACEVPLDGYPKVSIDERRILLEAELGTLYAGRGMRAFREPVRFWAREEAAGKTVPFRYELMAEGLPEPVRGTLVLAIEAAALKSV